MDQEPVVIIGAGPAGIATAVSLAENGVRSVIIDREAQVASSWRGRYDRLKLDTNKWFSCLPHRPYPKGTPIFPTRVQVADYYERHARIGWRRASAEHGGQARRPAGRRWLAVADVRWEHRGASRGGRDRSGAHTRRSGVARSEHLRGRIPALGDIPQRGALRREAGAWWSARARRVWISLTTWHVVARRRCGWPCARLPNISVAQPARWASRRCAPPSDVSAFPERGRHDPSLPAVAQSRRSVRIRTCPYPRRVPSPRLTDAPSRRPSSTWM